jgi:ankyrin repeat protein
MALTIQRPGKIMNSTALHEAVERGDLEKVQALLKDNPNLVFSKGEYGRTPLHVATQMGHRHIAQLLRQHGGRE